MKNYQEFRTKRNFSESFISDSNADRRKAEKKRTEEIRKCRAEKFKARN